MLSIILSHLKIVSLHVQLPGTPEQLAGHHVTSGICQIQGEQGQIGKTLRVQTV